MRNTKPIHNSSRWSVGPAQSKRIGFLGEGEIYQNLKPWTKGFDVIEGGRAPIYFWLLNLGLCLHVHSVTWALFLGAFSLK